MCRQRVRFLAAMICLILGFSISTKAQDRSENEHPYKPVVINLNEDGSQFLRFLMWHQVWLTTNNLESTNNFQVSPSIRRSRFMAYAKISPRFLILTHFGLNSLSLSNMTSLGNNGDGPQLFLHGAWGEVQVNDYLSVGGGLHYWNGLTRLSSQSTITFMTMDQSRPFTSWHSLGITDQFARHLGVYAKGQVGKFEYRLALNAPLQNNIGDGKDYGSKDSGLCYDGVSNNDINNQPTGNTIITGYFKYNFFDPESMLLPYQTGTYLGKKKVVAIGTGFFLHPNGMYSVSKSLHSDVSHLAVDAFVEWPTFDGAIHAYTSFIRFDYGNNYVSRWAGTGTAIYGELGYYYRSLSIMPYVAYNRGHFEGFEDSIHTLDIGINYFLKGHNTKVTLEYHRIKGDTREAQIDTQKDALSQIRMQLQLFI